MLTSTFLTHTHRHVRMLHDVYSDHLRDDRNHRGFSHIQLENTIFFHASSPGLHGHKAGQELPAHVHSYTVDATMVTVSVKAVSMYVFAT